MATDNNSSSSNLLAMIAEVSMLKMTNRELYHQMSAHSRNEEMLSIMVDQQRNGDLTDFNSLRFTGAAYNTNFGQLASPKGPNFELAMIDHLSWMSMIDRLTNDEIYQYFKDKYEYYRHMMVCQGKIKASASTALDNFAAE